MHLELLVEDQSGQKMLEILVPKIITDPHTFRIHSYKGVGRIPRNMKDAEDPSKRILLQNLPKLLKGYGQTFSGYDPDYAAAVVLICDLDDRCLKTFRAELLRILNACKPKPNTTFCFAIEEGEAWLLGDLTAIKNAYPRAKTAVLDAYVNDSICGTWEKLADAVYTGGSQALSALGWQAIGAEKSTWAEEIAPHMDIAFNLSPSFQYFVRKIQQLARDT